MSDFGDQVYMDRVREALWSTPGRAAVMVGSGLSRNARARSPREGAREFPTWDELTQEIVTRLYPETAAAASFRARALREAQATSGMLRVAEEYRVAFGRTELDRLINELVPDLQFEPSELHRKFLDLPWADVVSTNWDTLLERTVPLLDERHYEIVTSVAEIARAARPRIVKLHGTLPAQGRLIVTEDDFRCYPRDFAPFVNLAQQSMMENVFCLIGFSGDDPNFLHWSGWVRDQLGPSAPQIYLTGWLDLSPARRRLLESRGVVPIDLARLPAAASWPLRLRGQFSIEWLLCNLRQGEPYRLLDWPKPMHSPAPIPPYLGPIPAPPLPAPRAEPLEPLGDDAPPEARLEQLCEIGRLWRFHRNLYPGWVVAPEATRNRVWGATRLFIGPVLAAVETAMNAEILLVVAELVWRLDLCLVPLPDSMREPLERLSQAVDPWTVPPVGVETRISLKEVQEGWLRLGLALLREYREVGYVEDFKRWAGLLEPHYREWAGLRSRLHYERCLLALSRLEHRTVESELAAWQEENDDPFSVVRKASVMAEIGQTHDADHLSRRALAEIRQRRRKDRIDIASLSREGWAMMLRVGFRARESERQAVGDQAQRWRALSLFECDPWPEIDALRRQLDGPVPAPPPSRTETIGYGAGERTVTQHLVLAEADMRPPYQLRRLYEDAAVPPVADHTDLAEAGLLRVAAWLADHAPDEARAMLLRVCRTHDEPAFAAYFTAERVAVVSVEQVNELFGIVATSLEHSVAKASAAMASGSTNGRDPWGGRAAVAIELLARLMNRVDLERQMESLSRAASYYRMPVFRRDRRLVPALASLWTRALLAIGDKLLPATLYELVALPLPGIEGFEPVDRDAWLEPLTKVRSPLPATCQVFHEEQQSAGWHRTVESLIEAVRGEQGLYARKCGLARLWCLHQWGLLSAEEQSHLAAAIWGPTLPGTALVRETGFLDAALLKLPEREAGRAAAAFRDAYLAPEGAQFKLALTGGFLREVWTATGRFARAAPALRLDQAEARRVLQKIIDWWRGGGPMLMSEGFGAFFSGDLRGLCASLCELLGWQILTPGSAFVPNAEELTTTLTVIEDLWQRDLPVFEAYPALIHLQADLGPSLTARLRYGLASADPERAKPAVFTIWRWLQRSTLGELVPPPVDLARELGVAISVRRKSNLFIALEAAEWIFDHLPDLAEQELLRSVVEGLGYLLEEARYGFLDRSAPEPRQPRDVQLLRIRSARLARSVSRSGHAAEAAVADWLRAMAEEPMAEVRRAFGYIDW